MKAIKIEKGTIYDGNESQLYDSEFQISLRESSFSIKMDDFIKNRLIELRDNRIKIEYIIEKQNFKLTSPPFNTIKAQNNFEVFYCIKNYHLFLFSFGEKQYGRFILELEGIWSVKI